MANYRVVIKATAEVLYHYNEICEAESEEEALEICLDDFNFDPSMYGDFDGEIIYTSTDVQPA